MRIMACELIGMAIPFADIKKCFFGFLEAIEFAKIRRNEQPDSRVQYRRLSGTSVPVFAVLERKRAQSNCASY